MSINFKKLAAPFKLEELDWRILQGGVTDKGPWATCAAYVDARAIMTRLDDVCGPENWSTDFITIQGGALCKLSIRVGDQWVTKVDGSDETATEPFKGGLSKALVRAAVSWRIGRYLYDLPTQYAFFENVTKKTEGARWAKIKDKSGKEWTGHWLPPHKLPSWAMPEEKKDDLKVLISDAQRQRLYAIANETNIPDEEVKKILVEYGIGSSKEIPWVRYDDIVNRVRGWKEKVVNK